MSMMCPKCSLEISQITYKCPLCGWVPVEESDVEDAALPPLAHAPRTPSRPTPVPPRPVRRLPSPLTLITVGFMTVMAGGALFLALRHPPRSALSLDETLRAPALAGDSTAPAATRPPSPAASALPIATSPDSALLGRPSGAPAPMPLSGSGLVDPTPMATPATPEAPIATVQIESVAFPPSIVGGAGVLLASRTQLRFTPTKTRDGTAKVLQVAEVKDVHLALTGAKTSVELRLRDDQVYRFGVVPASVGDLERMLNALKFANRP